MQFQKDQIVWIEYSGHRAGSRSELVQAVVTKIGRRWAYLSINGRDAHRIALGTDYLDGGDYSSPCRVWASPEDFADSETRAAWREFRNLVDRHHDAPRGATPDNLLRICGILGISS